jgi:soluble lytic murein transglycosylase
MIFTRSRSRRRLLASTLAALLGASSFGISAFAAKEETPPALHPAKPKTAKPAAAKPAAVKPAAVKPAATKTAATKATATKSAAKSAKKAAKSVAPAKKNAAAKSAKATGGVPDGRAPTTAAQPAQGSAKATLPSSPILPTIGFSPISPAAAAALPAAPDGYLAPPPKPSILQPLPARASVVPFAPFAAAESAATPAADVALVKEALDLTRRGKTSEATAVERTIGDPLARKLVEWSILRGENNDAGFGRLADFIAENPSWPSIVTLRRRTEGALWDERRNDATVHAFFSSSKPVTAKGKFALARALLARGDKDGAAQLVRQAWREDACSSDVERIVMEQFSDVLTRADHKVRMDRAFYDEDAATGMRMGQLLGGTELAIAKARAAVIGKSSKAHALLEAVPSSARQDAGYLFSHVQWLRRNDKIEQAARLMLTAPRNAAALNNLDEWWTERKVIARKLLDEGDHKTAYRIASEGVAPAKETYRGDHEFTAGWIALRFLRDPNAAYQHFARVGHGTSHPTTLARGEYWQGRAAEAAGHEREARAHYQAAAQYSTAYYGQIARAKLGMGELALRRPPEGAQRAALMNLEVVRAVQLLYAADARELVIPFVADLAERAVDPAALVAVAEVARKNDDARAMLLIGKGALARGLALDIYAFPTNGIPQFRLVGPPVDKSVVYAIARQESAFNPAAVSRAKALGLMQVLPGTGKLIAKKFGFPFDQKRMLSDPAYNAAMGAAELGDVLEGYRGSYILSFVAYNAGRGRVRQWIEKYGDPRDPNVDPIDWVERIPFTETRNYVQRVLENMQVYRAQLGSARLLIEADLRRGAVAN